MRECFVYPFGSSVLRRSCEEKVSHMNIVMLAGTVCTCASRVDTRNVTITARFPSFPSLLSNIPSSAPCGCELLSSSFSGTWKKIGNVSVKRPTAFCSCDFHGAPWQRAALAACVGQVASFWNSKLGTSPATSDGGMRRALPALLSFPLSCLLKSAPAARRLPEQARSCRWPPGGLARCSGC